ncbi:MAG: hypothetical protein EOM50_06930 [Erysipelotrichia bacterium]|nr:hypothetical protein [Erysipelotrichia bacterium]
MKKEELVHSEIIRLSIFLKINQLRREQLESLNYQHIVDVLFYIVWDHQLPKTIHEAVDDIMKLEAKDVVSALHTLAMIKGSKMSLDKIDSILGGN